MENLETSHIELLDEYQYKVHSQIYDNPGSQAAIDANARASEIDRQVKDIAIFLINYYYDTINKNGDKKDPRRPYLKSERETQIEAIEGILPNAFNNPHLLRIINEAKKDYNLNVITKNLNAALRTPLGQMTGLQLILILEEYDRRKEEKERREGDH